MKFHSPLPLHITIESIKVLKLNSSIIAGFLRNREIILNFHAEAGAGTGTYLVEISEKQRALLANALHLREVVVLQRARAVRPEDEALQELYRYVQRHQANFAS